MPVLGMLLWSGIWSHPTRESLTLKTCCNPLRSHGEDKTTLGLYLQKRKLAPKFVLLKGSLKKIGPSSVQPCALFSEQLDLVEVSGSQLTWAAWEPLR